MNNIIRLAYHRREEVAEWRDTELWEHRGFSKYKLINRLCKWLVKKAPFLAVHQEKMIRSRYLTIDTNKIGEMIVEQVSMWHRANVFSPRYVFMGHRQMEELTRETYDGGPYSFYANINNLYINGSRREYKGLQIVIVPWLDGVLVMPEKEKW